MRYYVERMFVAWMRDFQDWKGGVTGVHHVMEGGSGFNEMVKVFPFVENDSIKIKMIQASSPS